MKLTPGVDFTNIYKQLLRVKIPKVQKDTNDLTGFFALLGSALVKGVCKRVGEIDPKKGVGVFLLFFKHVFRGLEKKETPYFM